MKISRNHAIAVARTCETKILQKKYSLEAERKETAFYCKKMNNKKRVRAFTKKELENFFRRNWHHRLEKYFKEQLRTFLERNKYSPHIINQRYALTYVF